MTPCRGLQGFLLHVANHHGDAHRNRPHTLHDDYAHEEASPCRPTVRHQPLAYLVSDRLASVQHIEGEEREHRHQQRHQAPHTHSTKPVHTRRGRRLPKSVPHVASECAPPSTTSCTSIVRSSDLHDASVPAHTAGCHTMQHLPALLRRLYECSR